jgi:vacuolar-type H+-ATPase subunit E/Vma4
VTSQPTTASDLRSRKVGFGGGVDPVINAFVSDATRRGERILADADADADAVLEEARRQAEALLASSRADGAAAARRLATTIVADAQRESRQEVLGAQRLVYDQVRARAKTLLDALSNSPEGASLAQRLGDIARRRLGRDATVQSPESELGVIARRGALQLNLSADVLLDHEILSMGSEIAELWS